MMWGGVSEMFQWIWLKEYCVPAPSVTTNPELGAFTEVSSSSFLNRGEVVSVFVLVSVWKLSSPRQYGPSVPFQYGSKPIWLPLPSFQTAVPSSRTSIHCAKL